MVTNDDGIDSVGLHHLARALVPLGEVVIVAPDREYSGASAAVGALHEIHPEVRRAHVEGIEQGWAVSGAPALCVMFARLGVFGGPFDLVVSGINPGANVSRAVYHSGTVGAAVTARSGGMSGVAVSQAVDGLGVEGQAWDEMLVGLKWHTAAEVGALFVAELLADLPAEPVVVNINVPNRELGELRGWRHGVVGHEPPQKVATARLQPKIGYADAFDVITDWGPANELVEGTDAWLVSEGYVSVSYLSRYAHEPRPDLQRVEAGFDWQRSR